MKHPILLCLLSLSVICLSPHLNAGPPAIHDSSPLDALMSQPVPAPMIVLDAVDIAPQVMHKNIIAKLHCESVLLTEGSEQVKFRAVHGDSEENKSFSKYTPSASLEMNITNPAALGSFEPGLDYLVTITAADSVPAPA